MTDDQVLAKVRAAAERLDAAFGKGTPTFQFTHISARAALAMVEQWESHVRAALWHDGLEANGGSFGQRCIESGKASAHRESASRIMSALRRAVGE